MDYQPFLCSPDRVVNTTFLWKPEVFSAVFARQAFALRFTGCVEEERICVLRIRSLLGGGGSRESQGSLS